MRVNSEKQTLILAGEPVPQRFAYPAASSLPPLTLVATPVEEPRLIAPSSFEDAGLAAASFAGRGRAYDAAGAYARTQQLFTGRRAIIDTYA